jgi:hypothetical protein
LNVQGAGTAVAARRRSQGKFGILIVRHDFWLC